MYLLPCSHCQHPLAVSPANAGGQVACPQCGGSTAVPKLGELTKLPRTEDPRPGASERAATPFGQRIAFASLGFIAVASLLIAGFCGVRWMTTEVPVTTASHIAEVRETYVNLPAANLIREYEDIERFGIDLVAPLKYHVAEKTREAWGQKAMISGGIALLAILLAGLTAALGKSRPART